MHAKIFYVTLYLQPTTDLQQAQEESYFLQCQGDQARMQIRVQAPVQVEIPEGSTLEQVRTASIAVA